MCHELYDLRYRKHELKSKAAAPKPEREREPAFALRPIFARFLNRLKKQPTSIRPLKEA